MSSSDKSTDRRLKALKWLRSGTAPGSTILAAPYIATPPAYKSCGLVTKYNSTMSSGEVFDLYRRKHVKFYGSSFRTVSGRHWRDPKKHEVVEIVYNKYGVLVSVRSVR